MDEGDESVGFLLVISLSGFFLLRPVFYSYKSRFFRLWNQFFTLFFVIIKVTEKLEKKGKGHARVFVGFDLDQVSEDEV